uniref:Uncharacterized protein n=1 Tax=Poecilia reticulata TaxID=8081 RepID=A0A3P9QIA6_POERE
MKLLLAGIVLISIIGTEKCCSFYASNTSKANCINSNKYYHARGNSDAAKRGNGEAHSNTDEILEIYKECSTNRDQNKILPCLLEMKRYTPNFLYHWYLEHV